jgi:hypothetical protein
MACNHLRELYEICRTYDLKLSSTDLIRIVCPQCGVEEVCPSMLYEQYESSRGDSEEDPPREPPG